MKILLNNEKFITIKCLSGYVHSLINDFSLLSDEHMVKESVAAKLQHMLKSNLHLLKQDPHLFFPILFSKDPQLARNFYCKVFSVPSQRKEDTVSGI